MNEEELKNLLSREISKIIMNCFGYSVKEEEIQFEKPENIEHGHYSTNIAKKISRRVGKPDKEIAKKIVEGIEKNKKVGAYFEKSFELNGFVNIFFANKVFHDWLKRILSEGKKFGSTNIFQGKKVQVEFISANPTGPLTLGNGRGGYGGDVLANVFRKAGANVEREYYVNDGGNQIKMLANSVLAEAKLIEEPEERYRGKYLEEFVKEHSIECKNLKNDLMQLGQVASNLIISNLIKPAVAKMKINFDNWFSEKELIKRGEVEEALKYFEDKGLTYEKEGALWYKTTDFGDDKDRVLIKSDGEKTYFANDTAYHWDKFSKRKFDKVVDIWGADHHGYVARMQAATQAMGFGGKLDIIITQLVRLIKNGEEFKMSKRKGTYISMDDLFELIGGTQSEASDIARFFFLSRDFNTHMDFDLDLARETSEKNPVFYVKYAYARMAGILRNAGGLKLPEVNLELIKEPVETDLIGELTVLIILINNILSRSDYPIHHLTYYAFSISSKFHSFYDKCRVIDEKNPELTAARLELVKATQIVLGIVMEDLIGIEAPEKM